MSGILDPSFFNRSTLRVAEDLLGKFLVRKIGRRKIAGMITEVEAYVGPYDKASHASRGRTPRVEVMFGKPGRWYVYLVYGMHHCLNIVTEREGYPAAVLIRSVECKKDLLSQIFFTVRGPGRVCRYFKIDRMLNKKPAARASGLWIEERGVNPHTKIWCGDKRPQGTLKGVGINPRRIGRGKRIGVEYAGKWKEKKWRFSIVRE